ncbi:MAG: hypothetical protein N5P05_004552 (plasmid) [Chroococcopsis gigantea SAG 12.99]|jgi:hypothetical protein|nr:hypothetical protein [Chroococcopsis gigantea SAG 12.99]
MESKKRLGKRNPLQLFGNPEPVIENPESVIRNPESVIENPESVIRNHDSLPAPITSRSFHQKKVNAKISNPESGIMNQESVIMNPETQLSTSTNLLTEGSDVKRTPPQTTNENQESGIRNQENERLYNLSIRVPENLNDALDDAVKITRRTIGQKIRKERLVAIAIEAMLEKVERVGGWNQVNSEEALKEILQNRLIDSDFDDN